MDGPRRAPFGTGNPTFVPPTHTHTHPNKHAGSDLETFRLQPVMATLPACSQNCVGSSMSDATSCIQFGFGCLRFWPNGSNTSASWCASIIQPALATASKQSRTRCKSDPARPTGNQTFVPSLLLTPKAACPEARHVAEAGWPTPGPGHKSSSITITMQ